MNYKKNSPIFLVLSLCFSMQSSLLFPQGPASMQGPGSMQAASGPMPTGPGGQQLSLEDLQAMEQFVEAERAKMTDEQRAQFDQDVMQLTKEFEKMQQENPEQFASFIDQMLFGQPTDEVAAAQPLQDQLPEQGPVPVPTPEESSKAQANIEKQDAALKRINTIIKHTSSFLNKTTMMIEFPGKLKKWAEQGKIAGWIPGYTWESDKNNVGIKEQLEKLLQKLNAIKEQDRATKTYKYLDAVIANEALYKNLGTLERKLKELEPQVEIDEFGLEPASKEVRATIRTILSEYLNALFALAIPQDIDSVIATFEPAAEKYRKEEEESTKKATDASKATRPAQRTVVAGSPDDNYSYSSGSNSGMNPYDYFPYSNQQYQPVGDYGPSSAQGAPERKTEDSSKKPSEENKGKGSGKESDGKKEEPKDTNEDKKIRKSIEQLEGNMTEAAQAIDAINDRPAAASIPADALATGVKKLKQATGNLNALKIKISKASTEQKKSRFKDEIREAYSIHKETLNSAKKITGSIAGAQTPQAPTPQPVRVPELSQEDRDAAVALAEKQIDAEFKKGDLEVNDSAVQRPARVKKRTEEIIKKKTDKLAADAQAQAAAPQGEQEPVGYSLQDLIKAVEDAQKAFGSF